MNIKKLSFCLSVLLLAVSSCKTNDVYFDGNVLDNYRKYDITYNPDTFNVRRIDSLNGRKDFIFGADISLYSAIYESGAFYYNQNGKREHICKIMKDAGINVARLRLFYEYDSPSGVTCGRLDLPRVISMISDCKKYCLKVLLDFHYSDSWADPAHQQAPHEWRDAAYSQVLEEMYSYTKKTLQEIKKNRLSVDYVQIGNEIDNGLVFPYGQIDWDNRESSYTKVAEILSEGCKATREVFPKAKIIIHTANGLYRWTYEDKWGNVSLEFYEALEKRSVDYDIIGASFYTFLTDTPINMISDVIDNYQNKIGKPVLMCETSYAFTYAWNEYTENTFYTDKELPGYPVTFQGQTNLVCDMIDEVASAKDKMGLGVCYWGGEFIPNTDPDMKSSWANQALFTYEGIATPTLSLFNKVR